MRTRAGFLFLKGMQFNKPAKSIQEQIELLKSRGLSIPDESKACHYLANISYYRLSAYMLPFQRYNDPAHTFMPGVTFDSILNLYVFDRQLRLLIFDEIERIEVAFRCQVIYNYCMSKGPNWYEDAAQFYKPHLFAKFLTQFDEEFRQSKEVFIQHYREKYTNPSHPPAWMGLEILSFGQSSKLFKNLVTSEEKKAVGKHFKIHHMVLSSWMESLSYMRNICAHHSRLWNRTITVKPTIPNNTGQTWIGKGFEYNPEKIGIVLASINYLIKSINPGSSFKTKLKDLMAGYKEINLKSMGLPENWDKDKFWN